MTEPHPAKKDDAPFGSNLQALLRLSLSEQELIQIIRPVLKIPDHMRVELHVNGYAQGKNVWGVTPVMTHVEWFSA